MRDICQDVEDNSFLLFLITLTFTVYPSSFISSQPSYHFILFVQFQCILCVTHTRLTNSLNIFLLLETILGFFFFFFFFLSLGRGVFPDGSDGKESACNDGDLCSIPERLKVFPPGKILWRREWQPTPGFLLGEFHG